ncbi:MAG: DinB family protein [Candidatus Eremiobacteraeota bacterium]|nr:DinB family protein [Candidatus Eremiobacteraeota bacterium]
MPGPKASARKSSTKATDAVLPLDRALVRAYDTSDRITRYLIEALDESVWRAEPPGGKGRTIAAIVSHLHNVRVMWLKVAAKGSAIPEQLDLHTVTRPRALAALQESRAAIARLLAASLAGDGRVKGFKPDAAGFLAYLLSHDAHHRGQITMLARQMGAGVSQKTMFGMWEWGARSRETNGEQ